jgi:hypothetical protein
VSGGGWSFSSPALAQSVSNKVIFTRLSIGSNFPKSIPQGLKPCLFKTTKGNCRSPSPVLKAGFRLAVLARDDSGAGGAPSWSLPIYVRSQRAGERVKRSILRSCAQFNLAWRDVSLEQRLIGRKKTGGKDASST